jgi:hypothetical protein
MRYKAQTSTYYEYGTLNIKRKGYLMWEGMQLGSGFDVEITYDKHVTVDGGTIGINDKYDLTSTLAEFLTLNRALVHSRVGGIEALLASYRQSCQRECKTKADALTYDFLLRVYDHPGDPGELASDTIKHERDLQVRQLLVSNEVVFRITYERLAAVSKTELATWWYIFWVCLDFIRSLSDLISSSQDDFWRRNWDTISKLKLHAPDFNPHYPSSIAYTPLPRPALESFLTQRGLLHKNPQRGDFIDNGFLNKVYVRMYDIVFRRSSQVSIVYCISLQN